jgi:hypothetical protein
MFAAVLTACQVKTVETVAGSLLLMNTSLKRGANEMAKACPARKLASFS